MEPRHGITLLLALGSTAAAQSPVYLSFKAPPPAVQKIDLPATPPIDAAGPRDLAETQPPAKAPVFPRILHDEVDGTRWALGGTYKASFGRRGATFLPYFADAPRNFGIAFDARNASVASEPLYVADAEPTRSGDVVTFDHGGMRVVYELRESGIEQSVWFDSLPVRGEIRVELDCETELRVRRDGGGFMFWNDHGEVSYGAAVAIDAGGKRVAVDTECDGSTLSFRVPAQFVHEATLPLVIDPMIGNKQTVYTSTASRPITRSDIAYEPSWGEYCVVFQRYWTSADIDVFAQRYDYQMNPIAMHSIDTTGDCWERPKVASDNPSNRFLVVAQVSLDCVSPFKIAGRLLLANSGVLGNPFDIERVGLPGSADGDKINPDVGGNPDYASPSYFQVVWERVWTASDHDIHMRQVDPNGILPWATVLLDNSNSNERNPAISKSCGGGPSSSQCWGVTWQRTWSSNDEDVHGALVRHDGALVVPPFTVNGSSNSGTVPSVSSPTDEHNGQRYWLFVYQDNNNAGTLDIHGTVVNRSGVALRHSNLNSFLNPGWGQFEPSVDCDGCRFAVGYTEWPGNQGFDVDAWIATFGYVPGMDLVLQDFRAAGNGTDAQLDIEITSTYAPGSGLGRFGLSWSKVAAGAPGDYSIEAQLYDGVRLNGGIRTRATACGGVAGWQVFGRPVIGGRLLLAQNTPTAFGGFLFGLPTVIPIPDCPGCTLGVDGVALRIDPLAIDIPCDALLAGTQFSVQSFQLMGGPCYGAIALGDTMDVTLE